MTSSAAADAARRPGFLLVLPWDIRELGGVTNVVANLARVLPELGADPVIFVSSWDDRAPRETRQDGRAVVYCRCEVPWGEGASPRMLLHYLVMLPFILARLRAVTRRYSVRTVNFHYPSLGGLSFALLKLLRLYSGSLVLTFHGQDVKQLEQRGALNRVLWRFLLRRSDAVIACSANLARRVELAAGLAPGRVHAVHNGIDPARAAAERGAAPPANVGSAPFVLSVGTFERKKGQDVLINAFAALASDHPDLKLVLIGADGPTRGALEQLVATCGPGIAHRIDLLVNVAHGTVLSYMQKARLFALPSREEPFGIVLLEAGLSGAAVVASRTGGVPEIIDDGSNGLLVDPENANELEAAIRRLLADDALSARLARKLEEHVLERFAWRRSAAEYLRLAEL
jgi:glycosyltransferase involved in cell wall biosynthesis